VLNKSTQKLTRRGLRGSQVSRRTFLRGTAGATVTLPFLESIAAEKNAAPSQKLAFYYMPIGVVRKCFFPKEEDVGVFKFQGANTKPFDGKEHKPGWHKLTLSQTMKPLEKMASKITLVTGLDRTFQDGTDVHAQCASCYLSSAAPYGVKNSAWPLDRTLDHIVADHIGNETPFKTLEFSCNSHKDNKESLYFDNISWYGTGYVAPSMRNPRKAYKRLFGTAGAKSFKDVTDLVLADAKFLQKQLSKRDNEKFEEYFESIRTIERQMDKLEKMSGALSKVKLELPVESYIPRGEYIRLMSDIMILALQSGLTNVASMMVGPERWDTPYKFESLFPKPMSHHMMSHNQGKHWEKLAQVDKFYMEAWAYMLEKMDAIKESDGTSLLDNTIFTYGSGLGDGATHQYNALPTIIAGGSKKIKTGGHLHVQKGTPLANLWLTQANIFGLKRKRFADSTGPLNTILKS